VVLPVGDTRPAADTVEQTLDERPAVAVLPMRRRDGKLFPGARDERRYTTAELLATESPSPPASLETESVTAGVGANAVRV